MTADQIIDQLALIFECSRERVIDHILRYWLDRHGVGDVLA